ncbi:MAG: aldehyde dehydrogenase family protein [Chloroflexota bacterium]
MTAAATPEGELDASIALLQAHKDRWARLRAGDKVAYLLNARMRAPRVAERWVAAATAAKGIPPGSALAGEEWLSGPWALLFALNRLAETLRSVARDGTPGLKPGAVRERPDGQVVVDVFPLTIYDRLLLSGVAAEVWMQPGVTRATLAATMAGFYRQCDPHGRVALVLGAGNIASIPALDVLTKLFNEGCVCLLKLNPVNAYLGPFFAEIFARLIGDGYLRLAYGDAEVGSYLCGHPGIETIHMTGSDRTHDAIVFGTGPEGAAHKANHEPLLHKRITGELGNVSPTIVVPGPWTVADVRFQAAHIATQKMHNAGCNCVAAQVLVLPERWRRTPALLHQVRETLRETPRHAYYPGAAARQRPFLERYAAAGLRGRPDDAAVPCAVIGPVDPTDVQSVCFQTEAFGGMLAWTPLPATNAADYLRRAVQLCNETLKGTLGANIIIHPTTMRELGPAFDEAIAALRYGCVAVNAWTGMGFLLAQTPWGAYPGHTRADIGSGIGVVHNTYLFDRPQKSVVRGPFYPFPRGLAHGQASLLPKPPWFVTHARAQRVGRGLVRFEARPGLRHLPGIIADALRG